MKQYKFDVESIKALQVLFMKVLVERSNLQELLEKLVLEENTELGDKVLGYLSITNPPSSIKFEEVDKEDADL